MSWRTENETMNKRTKDKEREGRGGVKQRIKRGRGGEG